MRWKRRHASICSRKLTAIYERRNFAVEQERKIKESELNTQIAVEEKKKQIAEKVMEIEVQRADNDRRLREMKVQADIAVEDQRKDLSTRRPERAQGGRCTRLCAWGE